MIKIENIEVHGLEAAIRGMRNPMNSWDKSDSEWCETRMTCLDCPLYDGFGCNSDYDSIDYIIGQNDLDLMKRLAKGGPVHAKYRRMITVWVDITAPLYWWKEFDTYKVGTVANSCSTMHKIHAKEFVLDDFSHEHLLYYGEKHLINTISKLNYWRNMYLTGGLFSVNGLDTAVEIVEPKDKRIWWQMIQLLPSSYNQKRTVMVNYEVLHNIYIWRKDHKLDEWHDFCDWIKSLPYSEVIIE